MFPIICKRFCLVHIWKSLLTLGAVGAVLTLLAYGFTANSRAIPSTLMGKAAPDFSLTLFDGQEVRLSDFRGKVVFLTFDKKSNS